MFARVFLVSAVWFAASNCTAQVSTPEEAIQLAKQTGRAIFAVAGQKT